MMRTISYQPCVSVQCTRAGLDLCSRVTRRLGNLLFFELSITLPSLKSSFFIEDIAWVIFSVQPISPDGKTKRIMLGQLVRIYTSALVTEAGRITEYTG